MSRRSPLVKGVKKQIYIKGIGVINGIETSFGVVDEEGNIYQRQPDASYALLEPLKENPSHLEINQESVKQWENKTFSDGSIWRNQPNKDGEFELVCIELPKKFTSLSPVKRQGYSSMTGSSNK